MSADTIDWLAPVSGLQRTSRPRPQAVGGPSHSGISGVGMLAGVKKAPACEGADEVDEACGGATQEEALSAGKEPSYVKASCCCEPETTEFCCATQAFCRRLQAGVI